MQCRGTVTLVKLQQGLTTLTVSYNYKEVRDTTGRTLITLEMHPCPPASSCHRVYCRRLLLCLPPPASGQGQRTRWSHPPITKSRHPPGHNPLLKHWLTQLSRRASRLMSWLRNPTPHQVLWQLRYRIILLWITTVSHRRAYRRVSPRTRVKTVSSVTVIPKSSWRRIIPHWPAMSLYLINYPRMRF